MITAGIITYYILPASFLFQRFDFFFTSINIILIGMMLGLCFLCLLVFKLFQKAIIFLILLFAYKDRKLKAVILKNLDAHSKRNIKTSMMFTIALSFLIFSGTTFALISNMIVDIVRLSFAADMFVSSGRSRSLPKAEITGFLDGQVEKGLVDGYSLIGERFDVVLRNIGRQYSRTALI